MKILICEDEKIIAAYLQSMCESLGYHVCGIFSTVDEAIHGLNIHAPDIALLDMNMDLPDAGIRIGTYINQHIHIPFIFITAFSDDDTLGKAFQVKPHAYLVKPIDEQTLSANLKLAILKYKSNQLELPKIIELKNGADVVKVDLANLIYIESEGNYSLLYFHSEKREMIRMPFHEVHKALPNNFIRIHKSYIINTNFLEASTSTKVILNGKSLPIGRIYKSNLYDFLESTVG